jgi:hypothetical protein
LLGGGKCGSDHDEQGGGEDLTGEIMYDVHLEILGVNRLHR